MHKKSRIPLFDHWKIQSSDKVNLPGSDISAGKEDIRNWYEANVPSTVLATLVKNAVFEDPYFGKNMEKIPKELFKIPWWFYREFTITGEQLTKTALLCFDGINYKANVWLNGNRIASSDILNGAFRREKFNVSDRLVSGRNILAIEVIPPGPGDFTIGFVDWNLDPPDNNMGIFREVNLCFNRGVSVENPFVETKVDLETLKSAQLTVSAELNNHTDKAILGVLKCDIAGNVIEKAISISGNSVIPVSFTPAEYGGLIIDEPELWWPNNMGEPRLHKLELKFESDNLVSDIRNLDFGIRQVEDYINEGGHRGFKINGKKVLIKGAGWTDDLFLQDTHESLANQIAYVKHMNLNCIRLEGFWGKDQKLYDLCDQNGILMMVGWSCHWEHEEYLGKPVDIQYGGITEPDEIDLIAQSWEDQLTWVRHHPSIFVWNVGSDLLPHPDLEKKYVQIFEKYDTTRMYLNSTGGIGSEQGIISETEIFSEISGSSCVKMLGPYAYTPPVYWFTNKHLGGAYGFNTETCPGANIPPLESIKKMIPEDHLWPVDDVWEYHCGKNTFVTLDRIIKAVNERYGNANGVEDFAFKAQVLNYELMRPMFEAFQLNKGIATGVVQWMLNSAWPNMYWQLYDTFLRPNGAFYGARKACAPLHLLYDYGSRSVNLVNDHLFEIKNYKAQIRVLDVNSKEVLNEVVEVGSKAESTSRLLNLPDFTNITTTYFLDLRLYDQKKKEVESNFYWLSVKEDILDYEAEFEDWPFYTPTKEYADYRQLEEMEPATLSIDFHIKQNQGNMEVYFDVHNPENLLAFFTEMNIVDEKSGQSVLPAFWDDNYFSLLPGEKRKIKVSIPDKYLKGKKLVLEVHGWNVKNKKIILK